MEIREVGRNYLAVFVQVVKENKQGRKVPVPRIGVLQDYAGKVRRRVTSRDGHLTLWIHAFHGTEKQVRLTVHNQPNVTKLVSWE